MTVFSFILLRYLCKQSMYVQSLQWKVPFVISVPSEANLEHLKFLKVATYLLTVNCLSETVGQQN